jgi:hypothetical protein
VCISNTHFLCPRRLLEALVHSSQLQVSGADKSG